MCESSIHDRNEKYKKQQRTKPKYAQAQSQNTNWICVSLV